jgi:succinyl-diaminopimelate desuccinylase
MQTFLEREGVGTRVECMGERRVLYAASALDETPRILVSVHLDVVPAPDDLFVLRHENGRLLGRGTHDCLGNAVIAARALVRLADRPGVGVVFSTDEETGGDTSTFMVQRGYGARELVIMIDAMAYAVVVAQKGMVSVRLVATGASAHASRPWDGVNAIDRLVDGYLRVRDLFPRVTPPDDWHPTLAATMVQSGTVHNRVPDRAELTLNLRITETHTVDQVLDLLRERSGLDVETILCSPPVFFPEETPVIQRLAGHMSRSFGRPVPMRTLNGATDARHFVPLGVPIAVIGTPGGGDHGEDEHGELKGLAAYEDMLVSFIGSELDRGGA